MRLGGSRAVWGLLAAGITIRLVLAFTTDGQAYDIRSLVMTREALGDDPLHLYATLNGPDVGYRWPYPGAYLPFISLAGLVSDATGLAYTSLVRFPSILADAAIALIVQDFLGRRGADERQRVAATALVALGPSFIAVSGYHGQIDSIAILPAVAALWAWEYAPGERRALYAGLLIGLGGAFKTTPLIMLLALIPAVRSWREAATLCVAAAAVPLATILPFLIETPGAVRHALGYHGFPGTSGLTFLLQPELSEQLTREVPKSPAVEFLHDKGQVLIVVALLAVTSLTRDWRSVDRAAVLWLAFYVVTPVFFTQYLVWGLPFLLMAGRLRLALAVQAAAFVPMLLAYLSPWESKAVAPPFFVAMIALWGLFVAATAHWLRGGARAT